MENKTEYTSPKETAEDLDLEYSDIAHSVPNYYDFVSTMDELEADIADENTPDFENREYWRTVVKYIKNRWIKQYVSEKAGF